MISNHQTHEMELNGYELVKKSKSLALKSIVEKCGGKAARSLKVWKSEEASNEEVYDGDSNEKEMAFIINRFQQLEKKEQEIL